MRHGRQSRWTDLRDWQTSHEQRLRRTSALLASGLAARSTPRPGHFPVDRGPVARRARGFGLRRPRSMLAEQGADIKMGWAVRFALCIAIAVLAALLPDVSWAASALPRSVLILDQSDSDSAWYAVFAAAFRSTLSAEASAAPVAVYTEHLDLSRFQGRQHDEVLLAYLRNKFRERPIGVLVAQGSAALEFVMRTRAELWPAVPVVFAAVDEETVARLDRRRDVTGTIYQLQFGKAVTAA